MWKAMKQHGPIPKTIELAPTLAQRLLQLRELRNMTVRDLARSTRFGIKRIEDIQSGLETWLSAADRQVLAKALTVEPALIEEVEVRADRHLSNVPETVMHDLSEAILERVDKLNCPVCGNALNYSLQNGFDINGNPMQLPRANCTQCPFVLR